MHPGTVSRALNPETRRMVNEETAQRVLEAAAQLGYRPNPIARGLKTNRSHTIGVLVPDLTNPLFPPIVRGIQDRLEAAGYTPLIANTDNDPDRERNDFEAMRARQVDGVITATARLDHGVLDEMAADGLPIVLVNRRLDDGPLSSATADDHDGARLAVKHLVGARPHPDRPPRRPAGRSRPGGCACEGFLDGMTDAGLEPGPVLCGTAFTEPEGARLCRGADRRGRDGDRRRQRPDGARRATTCSPSAVCAARTTSRSSASTTCRSRSASTRR